jgi:hypothetical protein
VLQVDDTINEVYRELYRDIYVAGMEARRMKNIYNVNGTAILIDSSLAKYHNSSLNSDLDDGDSFEEIFTIQIYLAAIMAMLLESKDSNHNPIFITQFNQDRAW